jgi:hypothetical protein
MVFIGMMMNFIFYLSLIRFVDSPEKYEKLIKVWLLVHVFMAFIGILKGGKGIGGFLGDENDLCMTLNMVFPFFWRWVKQGKRDSGTSFLHACSCLSLLSRNPGAGSSV